MSRLAAAPAPTAVRVPDDVGELRRIALVPVASSNVAAVGYDAEERTLYVAFTSFSVYAYFDISATMHIALVSASSIGTYLRRHIVGNPQIRYARVPTNRLI